MRLPFLLTAPRFDDAQCTNESDQDFFFPTSGIELEQRLPRLQQLCGRCVHQADCLEFAINNQEQDGFWGGKTPDERKLLVSHKEAPGTRRHREIQHFLSLGLSKQEVAKKMGIQVASLERTLFRASQKGLSK
jgi:hypothetical protein